MSEPRSRPAPAPGPDDAPQWANDLVPIAEYARALLRADAPALLVAVVVVLATPQLVVHPAPWVAAVCVALGGFIALRHGGRARAAADASTGGTRAAAPRSESEGRPGAPRADAGAAAGGLRPGARTGALLAVLDLLLTATGLAALAGLALAGADRALLVAAAGAATGLTAGVGASAVMELMGRRSNGAVAALAVAVIAVVAYGFARLAPTWWWVLGLAIGADAVSLIALRAGARNDRRAARPADNA
ncbi:hypothetical protein SAMN05216355_12318 [Actinomyces ruminicola]|uniref:Uncharacterized protein n=1 Tax=Actinomyces ruminicola TaxID=332524 RepID=A0A1H0F7Z0_9ACTO|nr:hypothetical protein [Actinomyces ruminicola]SDN90682.1 hypothetical protein SAMN05216355_12318 [Actinomyces ruminicola]